jgi:hypothetical protein
MDGRTTRRSTPAQVRLAPRPGEQGHICTGIVFRTERGTLTLTTVTLAYSHAAWAEFCGGEQAGAAVPARVLEHAWEFFGGAPRTWLFEAVPPTTVLDTDVRALARRWGAVTRPFLAADGVRWGECTLRAVPERLLRRHLLRDLGLANRLLGAFVDEQLWRDHPHQRDRRVYEVLDEERGYLCPVGTP